MTRKQLVLLNSLVTYAAENVPGGLTEEEREVAQIVGSWVLVGDKQRSKALERFDIGMKIFIIVAFLLYILHWEGYL